MTDDARKARRAGLWVGLVLPLGIIAAASIVIASWMPELPDPVAIHWTTDAADNFGPAWTYLALLIGLCGGMVFLLWAVSAFSHRAKPPQTESTQWGSTAPPRSAAWSPTARFLCAMNLGVAGMMSLVMLVSVNAQRGLADAADAENPMIWVVIGFGVLAGLAALGWFLQPEPPARGEEDAPEAAPLPLAGAERAVWMGTITASLAGRILFISAPLLLLGMTIVIWSLDDEAFFPALLMSLSVLVGVLALSNVSFRVRINEHGLLVTSFLGWPKIEIPASEITSVRTLQVQPLGDFGGWGWRWGMDGRTGIVLRAGEGIEVGRKKGRTLVVTIDDADTAAAVLARVSGVETKP